MKNITLNEKKNCTGCGACSKACQVKSISIERNINGFYSPSISKECLDCGICTKVCYKFINDSDGNFIKDSNGYLAYSLDDNTRYKASSGGIGQELSKYALNVGYEVCGAIYDYQNNNVKHVIIDSFNELDSIVGSKYIPSYTVEAFSKLDKNKKYLIIGTPCQIYGLRKLQDMNMLSKDNILVDFFCHGTPSLNLWDKYLEMIKRENSIKNITKVNFRDKTNGWHNYNMVISGDGNTYEMNFKNDIFSQFFLENVDLNEVCYECKLRFNKIYSDIRLGDFWGSKCSADEKGISILLTNTELGEEVVQALKNIHLESITYEELKKSQYVSGLKKPKEKEDVNKTLKSEEKLEDIYKKYIIPKKKKEERKTIIRKPINICKKVVKKIIGKK